MFVEVCQNWRFVHVSILHQHCSRGVGFFTSSNVVGCTKKPAVKMVIKITGRCFGLRCFSYLQRRRRESYRGGGAVGNGARKSPTRNNATQGGTELRGTSCVPPSLAGADRKSTTHTRNVAGSLDFSARKFSNPYPVRRCVVGFLRSKINNPYPVRC